MEAVAASDIDTTVYFYNPNIHPHEEYMLRKEENKVFAKKNNIPFIDDDYNPRDWFEKTNRPPNVTVSGMQYAYSEDPR